MYLVLTSQIISVGITPTKLPPTPLVGREFVSLQNVGTGTVYIANTFVTANTAGTGGYQLLPTGEWIATYTDEVDVWGVLSAGSSQVVVSEGK